MGRELGESAGIEREGKTGVEGRERERRDWERDVGGGGLHDGFRRWTWTSLLRTGSRAKNDEENPKESLKLCIDRKI